MRSQIWKSNTLNYGSWMLLVVGLIIGGYLLNSSSTPENESSDVARLTQVSAEPSSGLKTASGHIPIEEIHVGMRVMAQNPEVSDEERASRVEPNWGDWLHLSLVMPKPDGSELHIEMLRSEDWVRSQMGYVVQLPEQASIAPTFVSSVTEGGLNGSELVDTYAQDRNYLLRPLFQDITFDFISFASAGANVKGLTVELDLPELGLVGDAFVVNIVPCGQVILGEGEVVTATFCHTSGDVINLIVENPVDRQPEIIGTTKNHPFWSVDRQKFVRAEHLRENEKLRTNDGKCRRVRERSSLPGRAAVYNLEVFGEHVYFVGDAGILVHNTRDYRLTVGANDGKLRVFEKGVGSPLFEANNFDDLQVAILTRAVTAGDVDVNSLRRLIEANQRIPMLRRQSLVELATELPIIAPGSKDWRKAVASIETMAKSHTNNFRVGNYRNAEQLLDEGAGLLEYFPTYSRRNYQSGFEVHPIELGRTPQNNLPHIKFKLRGRDGHIFFSPRN